MRIGIIGAGQLGQMLGFAARELGDSCTFLDPAENPPAARAGPVITAAFDDAAALERLAAASDVVTYEFENVPVAALDTIERRVPIYPPPAALEEAQDRLAEKRLFERLEIPLPAYRAVDSHADLEAAARDIGLPLVLKTRRFGYDGKGQVVIRREADIESAWRALGGDSLIAEAWVAFDREVSALGVRGTSGEVALYPLTENRHADGILRRSVAPARDAAALTAAASTYLRRMLEALDYTGVLALELFVTGNRLLANEFAPRVHNSGHWTIEGARTSQFENHVRAITGRRLGPASARAHAGMLNLIGQIPPGAQRLEHGTLHDYGKAPRPGRKLGHITAVAESAAELDRRLAAIEAGLGGAAGGTDPPAA
ncbi:MAG: 5-(carboxyamino)imidazole ribonucleotide synthase [Woeseiaceae bacterium]|nr:5-(carboxyamino)imidazole ribonucleotide synthase [Woeseiaceae bacterium]